MLSKNVLYLRQGFFAKIRCLQELKLGTLNQIPYVEDILGLQTVGRSHCEF